MPLQLESFFKTTLTFFSWPAECQSVYLLYMQCSALWLGYVQHMAVSVCLPYSHAVFGQAVCLEYLQHMGWVNSIVFL